MDSDSTRSRKAASSPTGGATMPEGPQWLVQFKKTLADLPYEQQVQRLTPPEPFPDPVAIQAMGDLWVQRAEGEASASGKASIGLKGIEAEAGGGASKEQAAVAKAANRARTAKPVPPSTASEQNQPEGSRRQNENYQKVREILKQAQKAQMLGEDYKPLMLQAREVALKEMAESLKALDPGSDSTIGIRNVLDAAALVSQLGGGPDCVDPSLLACLEVAKAQMERAYAQFEANPTRETATLALNKAALAMQLGDSDRPAEIAGIVYGWAQDH